MKHFYDEKHPNGSSKIHGWFTFPALYSSMVKRFPSDALWNILWKPTAHFVEVGAWKGRSAAYMGVEIINSGKNIKFDCIDLFTGDQNPHTRLNQGISDEGLKDILENDTLYKECVSNLEPIKDYVNIIKGESAESASLYKDKSLDFVFLDAAHQYDNVKADLEAWYPKVKDDGVLAGHDVGTKGVQVAVCEFFDEAPPPNLHLEYKKLNSGTKRKDMGYDHPMNPLGGGCWVWDNQLHGPPTPSAESYTHLLSTLHPPDEYWTYEGRMDWVNEQKPKLQEKLKEAQKDKDPAAQRGLEQQLEKLEQLKRKEW